MQTSAGSAFTVPEGAQQTATLKFVYVLVGVIAFAILVSAMSNM
jgi:ABC-type transport system involved in cytochrome c biogenesis permease subunit